MISLQVESNREELVGLTSLEKVLERLGGLPRTVFRTLFSDEEWSEVVRSSAAVAQEDIREVRRLRLERQRRLLEATRAFAVPLPGAEEEASSGSRDEDDGGEDDYWAACADEARRVCENLGITVAQSTPLRSATRAEKEEEEYDDGDSHTMGRMRRGRIDEGEPVKSRKRGRVVEDRSASSSNKSPVMLANSAVSPTHQEEQEEEEEDVDELEELQPQLVHDDDDDIRIALEHARQEVDEISEWISSSNDAATDVSVPQLIPPDRTLALAEAGARVMDNRQQLVALLQKGSAVERMCPLMRVGSLLRWWALVERAFRMVGLFACLNGDERFASLVLEQGLQDVACSYGHAKKYERIGKLVLAFPKLLYQTQLVTFRDWLQVVQATGKPLVSCFEEIVGPSWRDGPQKPCCVCNSEDSLLWMCTGCKDSWFHDVCCGYEADSLSMDLYLHNGQSLPVELLCHQCLAKERMEPSDIAQAIAEQRCVAAFLNGPQCAFELQQIPRDGVCCFRLLHNVAQPQDSLPLFCKRLAKAALEVSLDTQRKVGEDAVESGELTSLRRLAKSRDPVRLLEYGLWKELEAQQIFRAFVNTIMKGAVSLHVLQIAGDGEVHDTYHGSAGATDAFVLQWNAVHFDRLMRRL